MGFAGSGVTEEHDRFTGVHEPAGGQSRQLGGVDGADGFDVELGKPFGAREFGFGDPSGAAAFGAVVDLGEEHFGQETEVGVAFAGRDLGQWWPGRGRWAGAARVRRRRSLLARRPP